MLNVWYLIGNEKRQTTTQYMYKHLIKIYFYKVLLKTLFKGLWRHICQFVLNNALEAVNLETNSSNINPYGFYLLSAQ